MGKSRQYWFGEFRLDADQRALFRKDELVSLTPKALETLLFLVERHGRIVDKKELMEAVWPDTFVEEVSLARNVSVLRKILSENEEGQSYIETIPKRGYRFVAPMRNEAADTTAVSSFQLPGTAEVFAPESATQAPEATGATESVSRTRFWIGATGVAVLCVGSVAYWLLASRPALSFGNRDWILVSDLENRTGDARFDKALLTALTVSLEQSRYANIFPRSRVYETLQRMGRPASPAEDLTVNEALGREICQRESLRGLVATSLTRTGKQYLLVGRLVDPKSGVDVRSYTSKIESEDQILDALDTLARNIRRDLGETLFSIRRDSLPLPHVTTQSLSALQLYAQAGDLWNKGRYLDARTQLQEALRVDPDFAMAHAALGNELYSHIFSEPMQGKQEYERALQLSGRVTARERMFIEASFAGAQNHTEEAVRLHRAFLEFYPDDSSALFNLATLLMRTNRCNEAIPQFRELIRINSSDVNSRINIATCYGNQSRFAEALPYYAKAFELSPERLTSANINREYGFTLVGAGQPEKAREVFALGLAKPESHSLALRSLGLLDLYEGRHKDAIARLKEAIEAYQAEKIDLGVARNRLFLSTAYAGQGNVAAELKELDEAAKLDAVFKQALWLGARIGIAYARAGSPDRAEKVLDAIRGKISPDDHQTQADAQLLEGEILVARGELAKGIELLQSARRDDYGTSIVQSLEGQARAYEKSGQPEKAISSYEAFLGGEGANPLAWEVQQRWLEAHYALAKLDVSRGNTARATELLDALLRLWKNADPDVPLLAQAKTLRESLNH
ncbi:MAG TPA: tetratricopeptide repeat protein [Methylomirabilota bacterium]|nr:tetratricopeptide repeat protein [Methylomirabilota bacterium]